MKLNPFSLNDRTILKRYLHRKKHLLSSYSFANIFIWQALFDLFWMLLNKKFCLFYKNRVGCFMPLPPLGGLDQKTISACFEIMEGFNHNPDISRIENIEEHDLGFFKEGSFSIYEKAREYIVGQQEIAGLRGERFKHKRNSYNFFIKNYNHRFRNYRTKDRKAVLALYQAWRDERKSKNSDPIYQAMLDDNFKAFVEMLKHFTSLEVTACVMEIEGRLKAFTSGFPLSKDLFCINYEIADLTYKGLASFIFAEFAKRLAPYPEINIMDDSGLVNLKRAKLSYHPHKNIVSYTALRKT
jgi:hypothetical protein